MKKQVVAVDVETTGLGHLAKPERKDAVVQIGMAWRAKGSVQRWSSYCNPGLEFLKDGRAQEALRLNGIAHELIMDSKPAKIVGEQFWSAVAQIETQSGREVVFKAFNRKFDEPFLRAAPWMIPPGQWGDCIMLDAQDHLGYDKWPRLEEAISALGIIPPEGKTHNAERDAHAALLIHESIHGAFL